jgi:hypothetical protein
MSSWVVVTGKANAGARRQLGSVQSADIQLIKTKLQAEAGSKQAFKHSGRQAGRQADRKGNGWLQPATDRPGPTHKNHRQLLTSIIFIQLARLPPEVNQYPPTGSANWPGNSFCVGWAESVPLVS